MYKYYANNYNNLDALQNQYLWFSKRKFLNDPYDLNLDILNHFTKLKTKLQEKYDMESYRDIVERFGICCFTTDRKNKSMWSLYANSYKGWCLEFDEDIVEPFRGVPPKFVKVQYQERWPDLNDFNTKIITKIDDNNNIISTPIRGLLSGDEKEIEKLFYYLLSAKEKAIWEHEKEYRLFLGNSYFLTHDIDASASGYKVKWKAGALKQIIIGHNIEAYFKDSLVQIATERTIPLYTTNPILQDETYKLEIIKITS